MNKVFLVAGLVGAGYVLVDYLQRKNAAGIAAPGDDGLIGDGLTMFDELVGNIDGTGFTEDMKTSHSMREMLKDREALRLNRYSLGDGGYTIGYGHFERDINRIPATITRDEAEALFDRDLVERGEKWVKLYVKVPLTQYQFDALVSVAYNMSPRSFKKFADQVNAGQGINAMAERSIAWVPAHLQNGIRNRRNEEMIVFNSGVYA